MLRVQVLATVVALTAVFVLGETRKYQKSGLCPVSFVFHARAVQGTWNLRISLSCGPLNSFKLFCTLYFINVLYCLLNIIIIL